MENSAQLMERYLKLRGQQDFDPALLDYNAVEKKKVQLQQLAEFSNSAVSVFDMFRGEHVFASHNFESLLGYDKEQVQDGGTNYFDSRIHPEDIATLFRMGIHLLEFFYEVPAENRQDFKMINEYRVLGHGDAYIRIVEQHQVLDLDAHGNLWLTLSIVDVAPQQNIHKGLESTLLNFRTGELVPLENFASATPKSNTASLSNREHEVLQLIQRGHLSKEISDLLYISVHTVNTHRQRILQKLGVDNSMEAVQLATKLGLLG